MANSRSGAVQRLSIDSTLIAAPGMPSGLTGFSWSPAPATFSSESGGLTTTHNAGPVVITGSFTIDETDDTLPVLLDANGSRVEIEWEPHGTGADGYTFDAVLTVSRTFADRGKRTFQVSFTVDGTVTIG